MNYLNKIIEIEMQYFLRKSFKQNGIEKTEDIIKSVYNHLPELRRKYLAEYNKLIGRQ